MIRLSRLQSSSPDFASRLEALTASPTGSSSEVEDRVREIIAQVRARGDAALVQYTRQFDDYPVSLASGALSVPDARLDEAWSAVDPAARDGLEQAAERIRAYHEHQRQESWSYREADGTVLGQRVRALDRVGIYVPGGKAAYPSSVLMNAIPARVAGVEEIVMTVPAPGGRLNDLVLVAARLAGVQAVFTVGGAQAIAALAYGTETVPRVDKIVGPGNEYVATAKRLVFGEVGIDMIAGPSEILVLCDGATRADWIAMDLFSQAEHDEQARALLLSPDLAFLDRVEAEINRLLPTMPRCEVITASLQAWGALIHVRDLDEGIDLVNRIAPEHLELSVREPQPWLDKVRHAGAVFLGPYTAEVLGDYCAGPNHVLPTAGTARFSSPLGVYDFQKRTSVIGCSAAGAARLARTGRT